MRSQSKKRWFYGAMAMCAMCLLTAGALGFAAAQDGDAELPVREPSDLSGPDQLIEGERISAHGTTVSQRVDSMLEEARRERDIIRVTCLNDKLTQLNANLTIAEQRLSSLRQALSAQDSDSADHEFTVMTVLGQKFNVLEQEANQCIGQDIFETGTTQNSTSIDPNAPDEDPTVIPDPPIVEVPFIPPPLSPTT